MSFQLLGQRFPLLLYRHVPVFPAPALDPLERPGKAVISGFTLHHPCSFAGLGPIVGKTQKIETTGGLALPGP